MVVFVEKHDTRQRWFDWVTKAAFSHNSQTRCSGCLEASGGDLGVTSIAQNTMTHHSDVVVVGDVVVWCVAVGGNQPLCFLVSSLTLSLASVFTTVCCSWLCCCDMGINATKALFTFDLAQFLC